MGATPKDLIATAFYAYSTELLARSAERLDRLDDARTYRTLHAGIVARFTEAFVTPDGRMAAET